MRKIANASIAKTKVGPDMAVANADPLLGEAPSSPEDLKCLAENLAKLEFSPSFAPIINNRDYGGHMFRFDRPDSNLRVIITGGTLWLRENNVGKNDVTGIRNFFWTSNTVIDDTYSHHQTTKVLRKSIPHHGVLDLMEAVGELVAKKDPKIGELIKKRRRLVEEGVLPMIGIKIINRACSGAGHRCSEVWNRLTTTKNGRLLHPNSLPANLKRGASSSSGKGPSDQDRGTSSHACLLNVFTDQHIEVDEYDPERPNRVRCSLSLPVDARGVPDVARVIRNPWYNQLYNSESGSIPPATCVVAVLKVVGIFVSSTATDARMKLHALPVYIVAEPTRYDQAVELDSRLLEACDAIDLDKVLAEGGSDSNQDKTNASDSESSGSDDEPTTLQATTESHSRRDLPHFSSNVFLPGGEFQPAAQAVDRKIRKTQNRNASLSGEIQDRRRDTLSDAVSTVEANDIQKDVESKTKQYRDSGPVKKNPLSAKRRSVLKNDNSDDDDDKVDDDTVDYDSTQNRKSRSKSRHQRGQHKNANDNRQCPKSRSSSRETVDCTPHSGINITAEGYAAKSRHNLVEPAARIFSAGPQPIHRKAVYSSEDDEDDAAAAAADVGSGGSDDVDNENSGSGGEETARTTSKKLRDVTGYQHQAAGRDCAAEGNALSAPPGKANRKRRLSENAFKGGSGDDFSEPESSTNAEGSIVKKATKSKQHRSTRTTQKVPTASFIPRKPTVGEEPNHAVQSRPSQQATSAGTDMTSPTASTPHMELREPDDADNTDFTDSYAANELVKL